MPLLSIVIVNYNVKYYLEVCLLSVLKATENFDAEIIVVDNNSNDGSVEYIRKLFPSILLIENSVNIGFSGANNIGIRKSEGQYVLLLNPDTIIREDTLENCVAFMNVTPDSGALGVYMIDGSGCYLPESKRGLPTPVVAFYKVFGLSRLFSKSIRFNKYYMAHLDKYKNNRVEVLSGAFMMLQRQVLKKVGLLDEDYFMYGEDIDLSYRIIKSGYSNYYFSGTRIIHFKGESTKKGSLSYVLIFYKAMEIFARKHFTSRQNNIYGFIIKTGIFSRAVFAAGQRVFLKIGFPIFYLFRLFKRINTYKKKITILFVGDKYELLRFKSIIGGDFKNIYYERELPIDVAEIKEIVNLYSIKEMVISLKSVSFNFVIQLTEAMSLSKIKVSILVPNTDVIIGRMNKNKT
ncbi:MAG: glycosyltransferase family 2 protein [Marinilabiliaceae bacterium]|nr:glycosyltransferase family 2 protein [Marinilabiliaceae bacterium]